ncbi:MAG: hypothetical protein Q9188_004686 [Gyalolechia gomerana]
MRSTSFRNLSALLAFLAATLLLFIRFELRHMQLSSNVENGTSNSTGIAVPFGHQEHNFPLFFPPHNHAHTDFKRAVSQDFQCLVEKGQQYWEQGILPTFDGQSRFPSLNFGAAEDVLQDSGWSMTDDMKALPKYWNDAFKATKFKVPKSGVREIQLDQNQDFENDYGERKATSGRYHGFFVPENSFVIMFLTWSPRFRVSMRRISPGNTPIPPEDIPKYLPRMTQLSDLV